MVDRSSRRRLVGAAVGAATLPWRLARAQSFPSRPITMYCPWPPGGGADLQLRSLAKLASATLGQQVLIENRPGATGTLGAAAVARARPDGYLLTQSHNAVLRQPFIAPTPWDPLKDFTYLIGVSDNPFGLVVKPDAPWRMLADFVEHARRNPDTLSIAVPGRGSPGHLVADALASGEKLRWTVVPTKGTADSLQSLLGGHVSAAAESTGWVPQVEAGRLRLLAVFGNRRMRKFPDVPTLRESGFAVSDFSPWGIVGPAGLEPEVARTLHDAFRRAMDDAEFLQVLSTLGQEPVYMSSDDYRRYATEAVPFQRSVVERYGLRQS